MSSRKKGGSQNKPSKSERADKMARKRDERALREAHRKQRQMESYLSDDENFTSFAAQMLKMGLQLRDIPGDGNCLFRALGDQLQGHGRNHHKFRLEVAKYMLEHRDDFEPFVEDDVPFDRHVGNLRKLGTYAGNDAIVAFARLHGVNVVIHQLNSPVWTIKGVEKPGAPELHISYHNGDHYSSLRRIGDNTESPANITLGKSAEEDHNSEAVKTFQKPAYSYSGAASYAPSYNELSSTSASAYTSYVTYDDEDSDYDNLQPEDYAQKHAAASGVARVFRGCNDIIEQVMHQTGCQDRVLVQQTLEEHQYDVDLAITTIHVLMQAGSAANSDSMSVSSYQTNDSGIWSENGTANRIFGSSEAGASYHQPTEPASKSKPISTKDRKAQVKREKKLRAAERHRQRLVGDVVSDDMDEDTTVVTHGMGILQI